VYELALRGPAVRMGINAAAGVDTAAAAEIARLTTAICQRFASVSFARP
jgi:fumarate hydratase class II